MKIIRKLSTTRRINRDSVQLIIYKNLTDSLGLHRVENLSYSDCAVSLHLYCPPFQACKVFNERTGLSIKAPVTFWSMYGKKNKNVSIKFSTFGSLT